MVVGWCSSSGCPSASKTCSPVSTLAWSASSSISNSGSWTTTFLPLSRSWWSATWFRIQRSRRSSTVLFFFTTNSQGLCSGEIPRFLGHPCREIAGVCAIRREVRADGRIRVDLPDANGARCLPRLAWSRTPESPRRDASAFEISGYCGVRQVRSRSCSRRRPPCRRARYSARSCPTGFARQQGPVCPRVPALTDPRGDSEPCPSTDP